MNNCYKCDGNKANYLTLKDRQVVRLCLECVSIEKKTNIWDDPNFWTTQSSFEE